MGKVDQNLRDRDGQLPENWYIACLENEVPAKRPISRVVYDRPYVLFRGPQGEVACLPDRCLHRHAQLSKGDVFDGKIGCPYHGWTYDTTGAVVTIPSEGDRALTTKRCLPAIPCRVQDGCVWIWTGKGVPTSAPPYRFPSHFEPGYRSYFMVTDFENEVTNLVENFMDVPHTVFVHAGWFRNRSRKVVPIVVETGTGAVLVTYDQKKDKIGFWGRALNPRGEEMTHTDKFIMPNITRVDYKFGSSRGFIISSQITPVSTLRSRVYTEIAYDLGALNPVIGPVMKFYTRQVITQDVEIMKNQGDSLRMDMSLDFQHTDADVVHTAIEELRDLGVRGDSSWRSVSRREEKTIWI